MAGYDTPKPRKAVTGEFCISRGHPKPFGASRLPEGINFAIFSRHAHTLNLVLYPLNSQEALGEIPLDPDIHRTGDVWHILVQGLPAEFEYGYRVFGDPKDALPVHRFDPNIIVIDPYAKALSGFSLWRDKDHVAKQSRPWRGLLVQDDFDWGTDRPLNHHLADTIIYELHVRGFTRHSTSQVNHPGTYRGLTEKIPYLQELGVTAVELLPVTEFDEDDNYRKNPSSGEKLHNFWGYHPLSFFALKTAYAGNKTPDASIREFKEMVRALHKAGIEVILDMVFNHTGEGNEAGQTTSFRGLDNSIYYIVDSKTGAYANFSGCGNTVNCNHPVVRDLIIDALCYWVTEMHVDGFRFDLASILGRGSDGEVLTNPPLLERIAANPILAKTKLIAEAWDAAGLYQVGCFPNFGRWAEWNGKFRDDLRAFIRGDKGKVSVLATRLAGSADLYQEGGRAPYHSVNFITSHDGFTLADLVSYEKKHNDANGEFNADGETHNLSSNHGFEGQTCDAKIICLRERQSCNFATLLILAHGVPMLLAGDEMGRSQKGNNNAWCQDNQTSWLDWGHLETHRELFSFFSALIAFRKKHSLLRPRIFEGEEQGEKRLSWHGQKLHRPDWSDSSHSLGMLLQGQVEEAEIYLIAHADTDDAIFELPEPKQDRPWRLFVDTALPPDRRCSAPGAEPRLDRQKTYRVKDRSVVVLVR